MFKEKQLLIKHCYHAIRAPLAKLEALCLIFINFIYFTPPKSVFILG